MSLDPGSTSELALMLRSCDVGWFEILSWEVFLLTSSCSCALRSLSREQHGRHRDDEFISMPRAFKQEFDSCIPFSAPQGAQPINIWFNLMVNLIVSV